MLVPECRVTGSCHSERTYGPGWLELGAVVGEVVDHSKGSYLCVQRGFGSLCLGPRDVLDLERSGSFNLTSVQLL